MADKEETQSKWQTQLDDVTKKILNREKFSYDLNGDAFYQQYKDKFTQQGKMAMMDTMGQAAALTGGYGSSYAQQVGQQAYQGYLQNLNNVVPELYQLALDSYNQEGNNLMNQYTMLAGLEDRDYSRERDKVADSQWQQSFDYRKERDGVSDSQWNQSFEYRKERDKTADDQWQQSFDEDVRQYNQNYAHQQSRDAVSDSQWQKNFDAAQEQRTSSGGTSGNESVGESGYELQYVKSMSAEEIVAAMKSYNDSSDDAGLAAFLDDLVYTGRITQEYADEQYELYRTGKDEGLSNTTVLPSINYDPLAWYSYGKNTR